MAINTLEYAQILQTALDKQVIATATTGWMEANAGQVIYNGGNEIKIPELTMNGLGNYDRDLGFVQGAATLSYKTKQLTQDRGRTFHLDRMDVDETNFIANATNIMGEFQRTMVVPEIDAYRYSSIAAQCIAKTGLVTFGYTASANDILSKIKADIYNIMDEAGEMPLVITVSGAIYGILSNSSEVQKQLSVIDFARGDITTKVMSIDGIPIMPAPSSRMKTLYTMNDGKTAGQEAGGFVAAATAKDINWIVSPRTAPIAISKTEKIRIFEPDTNQKADAYKMDYRKYHDIWIKDNQIKNIRVNIKQVQ